MWPVKKKPEPPPNLLGGVLLPEPTDPDWHEIKTTISFNTDQRKVLALAVGNVTVHRINESVPAGWNPPRIFIDGHNTCNVIPAAAAEKYMEAVWLAYFARQAARPVSARMKATCPSVGNNVEIAGWPVGAVIAALTVAEAKQFIAELEDATALATLDPEARDAARRLGAKGGS